MAITLLTRAGCSACSRAQAELVVVCDEFDIALTIVDVDEEASRDPELRAEFGDRLPVVLLDGEEHGYGEVDVARLRRDLGYPSL